eukprot:1476589-Amphidinium_carterae.1
MIESLGTLCLMVFHSVAPNKPICYPPITADAMKTWDVPVCCCTARKDGGSAAHSARQCAVCDAHTINCMPHVSCVWLRHNLRSAFARVLRIAPPRVSLHPSVQPCLAAVLKHGSKS